MNYSFTQSLPTCEPAEQREAFHIFKKKRFILIGAKPLRQLFFPPRFPNVASMSSVLWMPDCQAD